ncbi:hypothetical protein R1sor_002533 [Riccia sorocarpa]|uniref:Uncharacterized protein n=1 Tax=Riccia sorocarpa TaxID=122646 RepID=A0ABD3H178_9MARC
MIDRLDNLSMARYRRAARALAASSVVPGRAASTEEEEEEDANVKWVSPESERRKGSEGDGRGQRAHEGAPEAHRYR